MKRKLIWATLCLMAVAACSPQQTTDETAEVRVLTVAKGDVTINEQYAATIEGRQDIQILPQVSGKISRVLVVEGQTVRKGQTLFVIDQVPYQAALRTAVANVHAAEAQVRTARLDVESKKILLDEKVIGDYDYSVTLNALAVARAQLEQARAGEVNARNDLGYTEVRSPADGVVGTLPYRVGALVGPTMTEPLTTVSDNQQMYVYFSMTEAQLRSLFRQYGSPRETIERMPAVSLLLSDGTSYAEQGRIETISGVVNPQTGTASVRSVFPNPQHLLLSGSVGKVVIPHDERQVLVIPQSATYDIQDKLYVYKVLDGRVVSTEIKVEPLNDGKQYIVRSGLQVGDIIAAEGVGTLKDGQPISVKQDKSQKKEDTK